MNVVIRADASQQIGTGHVVRCLTLAQRLRKSGAGVAFACARLPGDMVAAIRRAGFKVYDAHSSMPNDIDWFVVDHYALDRSYEASMRRAARRIFVIDDLANRVHDCDLLLDQNLYKDMDKRYCNLVPTHAVTLTGPRYALLRPEFAEARGRVKRRRRLGRILVSFGGSDPTNETVKVLRALERLSLTDVRTDVLLGVSNMHRTEVLDQAQGMRNTLVLDFTERIADLMCNADLAIGAGGATSWERCCLGLPSITIAVAANQEALSQALADLGYQRYLGRWDRVTEQSVADAVLSAIEQYGDMAEIGARGMQLVDAQGVNRVVAAMESL